MRRARSRTVDAGTPEIPSAHSGRAVAERREERVGAGAAAIEEGAVVQVLGDEHVAQREHDRRVRRGAQTDALRAQAGMDVVVDRAEQHDLHAAPRAVREVLADGVAGDAAGDDGQVLDREAAERHEQVGLACDDLPRRRPAPHLVRAADDVAQRDVRGAGRVGAHARGGAAEQAVEAAQLALRVVEAPGAGPAVGAGVDGLVAVLADDAPELCRRAVERLLPADGDPLVGAAAGVRARARARATRGGSPGARRAPARCRRRCSRAGGRAAGRPGADRRRRARRRGPARCRRPSARCAMRSARRSSCHACASGSTSAPRR